MHAPTLHLRRSQLVVRDHVLEVFAGHLSIGRVLLVGATTTLDGPHRRGRYRLAVCDAGGNEVFRERIDPGEHPRAVEFVAALRSSPA